METNLQSKTPADLAEALKRALSVHNEPIDSKEYTYVIYARKSTESEERQVRSLGDQVLECKDLADKLGLKLASTIVKESESAKEPDIRPKFREMIEDVKKGKYDGIMAWNPDRLARNMKDAGEIIDLLDKRIIKDLKFVSFTFENNTTGKMLLGIAFVLSKQYSDQLSDNVKRGIRRSIEEGKYISSAKHGYYKDRNQFLRPDGDNFVLIKESFQMRLQGKSLDEIAEHLNVHGYSYARKGGGQRKLYRMDKKRVSEFLRDPFYCGVLLYGYNIVNLEEIYEFVPAVSVDEFLKMNKLSSIKKAFKLSEIAFGRKSVQADLLRGIVLCGKCGDTLTAGVTPKKGKDGKVTRYFYYRCDNRQCESYGKSTRAKEIINWVIEFLQAHPFTSKSIYKRYSQEMLKVIEQKESECAHLLKSLAQQKTQAETRLEKTKDLLLGETDPTIKEVFKKDLKKIENKLHELVQSIAQAKEQKAKIQSSILAYSDFIELFKNLAHTVKKTASMQDLDFIIRQIFLNFTLEGKKVAHYTLNSPFREFVEMGVVTVGRGAGN